MGIIHRFNNNFKDTKSKSGKSLENAIVIEGVQNYFMGVEMEYWYLTKMFGKPGTDWNLESQELLMVGNRHYDKMNIKIANGTRQSIYFDITNFFGLLLFDNK